MPQININIRMDENLKRDFENICAEMGLTMTSAFTIFAKAVSLRRKIPFRVAAQTKQRDITLAGEKAFAKNWLSHDEGENFDHLHVPAYAEIGSRTVEETAGIAHKWAKPELIPFEKDAWPQIAAENETRRLKEFSKYDVN